MKISLDGGALCTDRNRHFGNYTFSQNLIEAIQKYDHENEYLVYSFCPKPDWLALDKKIRYKVLRPRALWLSTRVSVEEIREKKDVFLALNQAVPLASRSQIVSFSHGLSFYHYHQFYPDSYHALKDELGSMVRKSRYIVVASRLVKAELEKLYPAYKHFVTINYGVPFDMLKSEAGSRKKYFLFVGMNHRIKNIEFLLRAYRKFRKNKKFQDYKFYLVGDLKEFEDMESGIFSYPNITREALRKLYSGATAYLTASFYESFNFPVLEALTQSCPVISLSSAIIPEFKEFVSLAYDLTDFTAQMIDVSERRKVKMRRDEILKRFSWKKYITKLKELYPS